MITIQNNVTRFNDESRFLTTEQIQPIVPSIYGYKAQTMSSKYIFTPTHEIIDSFSKVNWYPTRVSGVKPSKRDINTVKHLIRFASFDNKIKVPGEIIPEVVIINSHNGHCPLSAHLGFFRLVCANGLMLGTQISEMKWRHKKLDFNEVKQFILQATDEFNAQTKYVSEYQKIHLDRKQQIQFAEKTINMIWTGEMFEPEMLLNPRRSSDSEPTLFNTFNVIQEHVCKGGIRYKIPEERKNKREFKTTRAINNIEKETSVNMLLWGMMHKFYEEGRF